MAPTLPSHQPKPLIGKRSAFRSVAVLAAAVVLLSSGSVRASDEGADPAAPSSPGSLNAGPVNGGFESGLANWFASGNVQALQDTNFSPLVTPTQGGQMALLCSGPGNQMRVGAAPANLDLDPGPNDDNDRSILSQTFTLQADEVPATLSFDWSFITAEGTSDPGSFDDFFQVVLNGPDGGRLLAGSAPNGGVSPYPDVSTDAVPYVVSSTPGAGSTDGCDFQNGRSPFSKFINIIDTAGVYSLEFLVSDQGTGDFLIDSGLIVDNVQLTPEIDLEVTKTTDPNPVVPGAPLYYDLVVTNHGSGVAKTVILTDTLPAEVVYVDDTNVPPCVEAPLGTLTCDLGDMSGGAVRTFRVKTVLDADARGAPATTISNFVHVEAESPDRDPTNNDFTLRSVVEDEADLRIIKVSQPDLTVEAAEVFSYTIFVDNLGPSYARSVQVRDDILASGGFTLVSISQDPNRSDTCTPTAEGFDCSLMDSLEPIGFAPLNGRWTIEVFVQADTARDVTNLVRTFSEDPDGIVGPDTATFDPNMENNFTEDYISVTTAADLSITKIGEDLADGDLVVVAGGAVQWTIVVTNDGPSIAENVTVVDVTPPGLVEGSLEANATTPAGGSICTVGTPGDPSDPMVCQLGNLLPGQSATIVLTADVDPSWVASQPETEFANYLTNDAWTFSDTVDRDTLHNRVTEGFLEVIGEADLQIEKSDAPDPVNAGEALSYLVTVTNLGPSTAEGVVIDDDLPAGVDFGTADVLGGKGSCVYEPGEHRVRCNLDNMQPGEVTQILIVVVVDPAVPNGTVLTNTASRNDDLTVTDDSNELNDEASTDTGVLADADLNIEKIGTPVKIGAGQQVKYTISLDNLGPSEAKDVVVYDVLPDEVTYEVDTSSPMCTQPSALVGFRAWLEGGNEVPAVVTDSAGLATFVLNQTTNELTYSVEVSDIAGISAAHIHTGAAGVNGPVVHRLYNTPAPPAFNPPSPIVGSMILTAAEEAALLAGPGGFYVNIHTAVNPAGVIRGQLARAVNTPLRCEIGTMSANGNLRWPTHRQWDIWAFIDPATPAGSFITNVAIVRSPTEPTRALPAPNGTGQIVLTGDNSVDSFKNYIEGFADLKIVKFGKKDVHVRAGDILTYTVVVDNLGPSSAVAVAVKDILQSSGRFDLIDITTDRDAFCRGLPGPNPGITITATAWPPTTAPPPFGVLPPSGVAGINQRLELDCTMVDGLSLLAADGPPNTGRWILTMRIRAAEPQDVDNIADVVSETKEVNAANNHAEVEHEITAVADLRVTKTAVGQNIVNGCPPTQSPLANSVTAGLNLNYTIVVTNGGPSTAENVVAIDRLPPGITVTGYSVTGGAGSCSTGTPGSADDRLTCGLGSLSPGATRSILVNASTDPGLAEGTILENDVFVVSDVFEPINANNFASNLTRVNARADLSLVKTDQPDPVVAGRLLEYTLNVRNLGPSDAHDVIVVDTLDPDLIFLNIRDLHDRGVVCSLNPIDERTLTCKLPDMDAGQDVVFTIVTLVRPFATTPLSNDAVVSADTADPCLTNNADNEGTTVNRENQLFIFKDDDPDPVIAGTEITYTIRFGNLGPSTAFNVRVQDTLPRGVRFDRCESLDINDEVTCQLVSGDGLTTPHVVRVLVIKDDDVVVYTDLGDVDPGEQFRFRLIADVSSGYVLDDRGDTGPGQACQRFFQATGYKHYAHNRANFTSTVGSAVDDECTRVNSLADIEIDLSIAPPVILAQTGRPTGDDDQDAAANSHSTGAAGVEGGSPNVGLVIQPLAQNDSQGSSLDGPFLPMQTAELCSPISSGQPFSFLARVTNHGPSDAADVFVTLQLPDGFVHDPAFVEVTVNGNLIDAPLVEVRDDGLITVLLCRLNAGGVVDIVVSTAIRVEAAKNQVIVGNVVTIRDARCPNRPGRPTPDPDLENNVDNLSILVMDAGLTVNKTVSFDGTCPGHPGPFSAQPGQPVTYCYEIKNTGDTYLDNIEVTDTLRSRLGTRVIFTDTIINGIDPRVPVGPGETVKRQVTIPQLLGEECGIATDTVVVTGVPTNAGRTVFQCVVAPTTSDTLRVDVPCAGVDFRLQLPALDNDECETWIQVQNVGEKPTKALLVLWGEPGFCPPQAAGPLKVECSGLLRPGSAWSFAPSLLPDGIKSAIAYSANATDLVPSIRGNDRIFADVACEALFDEAVGDHDVWAEFDLAYRNGGVFRGNYDQSGLHQTILDFGKHRGEPIAITVNRDCPDPTDPNVRVHAAYTGVSSDEEGAYDPVFGGYTYYAPLVLANSGGLSSWLWIHNSGDECSSIEIWFKAQDNCLRPILGDVLAVAPGESVHFDPNTVVGPNWVGSAWIRGSQPLGIVVDAMGANHFTSYKAVTGDVHSLEFSLGTQVNYAPLIYNQQQGWDTLLQVQNLSSTTAAKVKVYFLDQSGGIVTTLADWICPRGSQSFFLPVISGLPGNWVGSARVESQEWWSPGDPVVDPPRVQAIVLLEKWDDPARTVRREAVAYNGSTERTTLDWQIGRGDGTDGSAVLAIPLLAKSNRGITSEIAITNLVAKPGFTDFALFLYDQNGLLDVVCEKLNEKQVEYIDLATWGFIAPRWLGSGVISATFWEHDVFDGDGQFVRNYVGLGAVVVERIGATQGTDVPGDESKAFEAFPVFDFFLNEVFVNCP